MLTLQFEVYPPENCCKNCGDSYKLQSSNCLSLQAGVRFRKRAVWETEELLG